MDSGTTIPRTAARTFTEFTPTVAATAEQEQTVVSPAVWPLWQRVAFRSFFIYFLLQIEPWDVFRAVPGARFLLRFYDSVTDWVVRASNARVFHVRDTLVPTNGSGDTSYAWSLSACRGTSSWPSASSIGCPSTIDRSHSSNLGGDTMAVGITTDSGIPLAIAGAAWTFFYLILGDGLHQGQSFAKQWLGMRVVSADTGKPCTYGQSFLRNILLTFLGPIDWIFIFGDRHQRLGDKAAGTIVVVAD